MDNIERIYQEKLDEHTQRMLRIKKQSKQLAWSRLAVFVTGITLSILTFKIDLYLFSSILVVAIVAFAVLLKLFNRKSLAIKLQEQYIQLNKNELLALKGDYSCFDPGNEYTDRLHPYTFDLDIFGEGSIFNAINRTTTINGKKELAQQLETPLKNITLINDTQKSITELKEKLEWRQKFQAYGNLYEEHQEDISNVKEWLEEPVVFMKMKAYRIIAHIFAALTILCVLASSFGHISSTTTLYAVLIEVLILLIPLRKVNEKHRRVSKVLAVLQNYKDLLSIIEKEQFESKNINAFKNGLKSDDQAAAQSIAQLTKLIDALDNRMNAIAGILLNLFLLWDLRHMIKLEHWKMQHKEQVLSWFSILGKIDALASLACFAFNHPSFIMPNPISNVKVLEAKNLGHPLLNDKERVDNDFEIAKKGGFVIITGPNMAGKSTFLRTAGVNLILAMAGAPVCATKFEFALVDLFSSMRTSDSLQKGESYFYAELKRLQTIVENLKENKNLFVILDEILKGTNSKDKEKGSKAFMKQMIELGGTGIIATHDLSLCEIEKDFPDHIRNQSFEVEIEGKKIHFDYLLRDGITTKMNATFLMEQMGIIN